MHPWYILCVSHWPGRRGKRSGRRTWGGWSIDTRRMCWLTRTRWQQRFALTIQCSIWSRQSRILLIPTSYWSRRFTWCAWLLTGCTVTACAANRTCWPSPCRSCLPSAARSPKSASIKPTSLGCFSGACLLYFSETEKHCLGNQSSVMSQRAPHHTISWVIDFEKKFQLLWNGNL